MSVVALALLAPLSGLPVPQAGGLVPALERERHVRETALRTGALEAARVDAHSSNWVTRFAFAEAARRRARVGEELGGPVVEVLRALVRDAHPNVRERALDALETAGVETSPGLEALARDPFPPVRAAVARRLAHDPSDVAVEALERLLGDPDARVRRAAAYGVLFHAGPRASEARTGYLERLLASDGEEARDELAWALARVALGAGKPDELRRLLAERDAEAGPGPRAVLAAVLLGRNDARAFAGELVTVLAAGWSALEDAALAPLVFHAARSGRADVARVELAILVDALALDTPWSPSTVARALLATVGPGGALRLARDAGSEARITLIDALPPRLWPGAGADLGLGAADPAAVREHAARFLATVLREDVEPSASEALELLCGLLSVPGSERRALRAIVTAASRDTVWEFAAVEPRLHRAWLGLAPTQRLSALADFPRGLPLPSFRADLLALGERGADERRAVVELLAAEVEQVEVQGALRRWTASDLARIEARGAQELPRTEELELRGELRALGTRAGENLDLFQRALALSRPDREDGEGVGKTAAAWLARSPEGRVVLRGALDAPLGTRTLLEAAIGLLVEGGEVAERAAGVIAAHFDALDSELATRALAALGRSDAETGRPFLERVACDRERPQEVRIAAVEALARAGDAVALARVLEQAGSPADELVDLDPRRVAVRALGELCVGGDTEAAHRARGTILRLSERLRTPPADEDELARERRELLAEVLLGVLARLDPLPEGFESAWLAQPLADGAAIERERFAGRPVPQADFLWRGELEAGAALAERGLLDEALARAGAWWEAAPSFCLALGEAARETRSARAAERLLAAASVGFDGLPRDAGPLREPLDVQGLRARRDLLALARARGDAVRVRRLAAALLADFLSGRIAESSWSRVFGEPQPYADAEAVRVLAALAR